MACELCDQAGGLPVWQDADWRVVRVVDAAFAAFPAYYRVVSQRHVVELSDLGTAQRQRCMALVCEVERVLAVQLRPIKMNLAALGNLVPHLHWHVVARFDWDSHFPQPIWGRTLREGPVGSAAEQRLAMPLATLDAMVAHRLAALPTEAFNPP